MMSHGSRGNVLYAQRLDRAGVKQWIEGGVHVLHSGSQAFTLTPNSGFMLDSLLVDGILVDSTTSYTFLRVISDHTIVARFTSTSSAEDKSLPHQFSLLQNFPNPFNPETEIRFSVETRGKATLTLFSPLGQEVERLFEGIADPGIWYSVQLQTGRLASGVYFYRLRSGGRMETKSLLLLK